MRKIVFLLLPCFFLGFCSFFKTKVPPYPSGIIFPLEKGEEIAYEGKIVDLIQKRNGTLYFSTNKGFVYCLDGLERKVLWKFEAQKSLVTPPYLGQERIYVLDRENTIYCLDKKGKLLWKKKIEENITSDIRENRGKIYLGTEEGGLFVLNSLQGELFWRFQAGGAIRSDPTFYLSNVIFGCDDGNLYFLSPRGNLIYKFEVGSKIEAPSLVDKNNLYFGSDDKYFYCYNLIARKVRWKIKTGGKILSQSVSDEKRIYFVCWNSVLYSLNKKNGTILWWRILPSRSFYQLEIIEEEKIVASSFSPTLVCFKTKSGEKQGEYKAEREIKSNSLWFEPYLLINIYEYQKDEGKLVFLKKEVNATLNASKQSPLKLGEELVFTASATGFFQPQYEFYLKIGDKKEIVQEMSEESSWDWYPEKDGTYSIGVRVVDDKEKVETEIPFTIEKIITTEPDLIVSNGKIRTMTEENPWVEALAVAKNKIIFAGKNKDVLDLRVDKTVVIDIGGNFALPGFIDSSVHMLRGGLSLLEEEIGKDEKLEQIDKEKVKKALLKALSEASKFGITTIQDCSPPVVLEIYKELLSEDKLLVRVLLSYDLKEEISKIKEFREKFKELNKKFIKLGAIRGDLDGNLAERKAALLAAYSDKPKSKGKLSISPEESKAKIKELEKDKFQIALEASGDRALNIALTGIEEALAGKVKGEIRHRIEKIQLIAPEDFEKFGRLQVTAIGCPLELIKEREGAEEKLGLKRVKGLFPWRTLLDKKAELAFASNWPQFSLNPLPNIYVALTREMVDGDPPGAWLPWEKISLDQALTAFTKTAARSCLEEKIKGTLEIHKLADIIIFSKNLYEIPVKEVLETEIIMTLLGGKIVYLKPGCGIEIFDPKIIKLMNIFLLSLNLGEIQI